MRPSELVDMRRELVAWHESEKASAYFGLEWETDTLAKQGVTLRQFLAMQPRTLVDAPLFFVAEHMTPLCAAAGKSLPKLDRLSAKDLPAAQGLMFWDGPPIHTDIIDYSERDLAKVPEMCDPEAKEERAIIAVAWSRAVGEDGTYVGTVITVYEDRERGTFGVKAGLNDPRSISRAVFPRLVDIGRFMLGFGQDEDGFLDNLDATTWGAPIIRAVLATWMLMKQSIVSSDPAPMARGERRRLERLGEDPGVTLVRLRRMSHRDQREGDDHESPEWTCRWLVTGHWRQQWLPSIGVHRPTWIAPYVKGPEDKPLRIHEKVTVLQR